MMLTAYHAQAEVIVRSVDDLTRDPKVARIGGEATTIAALTVIYDRCGNVYNITDEEKARVREEFDQATRDYMQAYQDAYSTRVGVLPEQKMVLEYRQIIIDRYQKTADSLAQAIATSENGCRAGAVNRILNYFAELKKTKAKNAAQTQPTTPTQ